jgi:hypothetical protein
LVNVRLDVRIPKRSIARSEGSQKEACVRTRLTDISRKQNPS